MTDPTLFLIVALTGLAWVVGGVLQWITLRKQERIIQEVQRNWHLRSEEWNTPPPREISPRVRAGSPPSDY